MNKPSKLAAELAGTLIVASLLGTSAFAESRHQERTDRGERQGSARQENRSQGSTRGNQGARGYDRGSRRPTQSYDRQRAGGWNRGSVQAPQAVQPSYQQQYGQRGQYNNQQRGQYNNRQQYNNQRGQYNNPQRGQYNNPQRGQYNNQQRGQYNQQQFNNRNRGYYGNRGGQQYSNRGTQRGSYGSYGHYSYPSRDGRAGTVMQGRISRINHERGGYRVWLDRGGYSYWVPERASGSGRCAWGCRFASVDGGTLSATTTCTTWARSRVRSTLPVISTEWWRASTTPEEPWSCATISPAVS